MPFIPLTAEQRKDHLQRLQDAATGVYLTEIGTTQSRDCVSKRILEKEVLLASPGFTLKAYKDGAAVYDDQIHVKRGDQSHALFSTEHATYHVRTNLKTAQKAVKEPETGIAGLAAVLARSTKSTHISAMGRQTGDPNNDPKHIYKTLAGILFEETSARDFVSVHGMLSGHVADFEDERGFDLVVGVGRNPNQKTAELGTKIVQAATNFGLRAAINQPFLRIKEEDGVYKVRVDDDGEIKPITFAASSPNTTRSYIEATYTQDAAYVQVELADTLRLVTSDVQRSEKVDELGPYLGFATLLASVS